MRSQKNANASLSAERASQLAFDQLALVQQSMKARAWARPIMATATVLIFSRAVAWPNLAIWLAVVFASCIPPFLTDRRFCTRLARDPVSAVQWQRRLCLTHGLFASAWTSMI